MSRSVSTRAHKGDPCAPAIAAFDFDGTLTDRHTLWRYLRLLVGSRRFYGMFAALTPTVCAVIAHKIPVKDGRSVLLERLLRDYRAEREERWAEHFACEHIPTWLRKPAIQRLRWHQRQGHTTVLVSNSAESYLRYVGAGLGIEHVFGTRFEKRDGVLTGRIVDESCVHGEKVVRLRERFGDLSRYYIYAYGDSTGDRELLAIADQPYFRPFRPSGTSD